MYQSSVIDWLPLGHSLTWVRLFEGFTIVLTWNTTILQIIFNNIFIYFYRKFVNLRLLIRIVQGILRKHWKEILNDSLLKGTCLILSVASIVWRSSIIRKSFENIRLFLNSYGLSSRDQDIIKLAVCWDNFCRKRHFSDYS